MRQCLDEGMLQSYFDGELSTSLMEYATSHLASCATCAASARELEEENALLSEAFALEFADSVPTERLWRKVDAAVAGLQVVRPAAHQPRAISSFFSSVSSLFSFAPQRVLGYAALIVMLVFGVIFGLVKLRSSKSSAPAPFEARKEPTATPTNKPDVVATADKPSEEASPSMSLVSHPTKHRRSTATSVTEKVAPVKLLPGERSYLQTIAKLDSTINEEKNMRPALQVEYQRNLAVVDRAIAATRNAAKKNPSDPDAADFMFAAYQSKVDLLNTIADARVYNRTH
jgi:hypothetical protein